MDFFVCFLAHCGAAKNSASVPSMKSHGLACNIECTVLKSLGESFDTTSVVDDELSCCIKVIWEVCVAVDQVPVLFLLLFLACEHMSMLCLRKLELSEHRSFSASTASAPSQSL